MKLRALLLDVDGTLADTEEAHRTAFNEAFNQLGLGWNWSRPMYAHLLMTTGGKERIAAYLASLQLGAAEQAALAARIETIHRTKTDIYTRMILAGEVMLRDGVARLLDDAARSGVRLGIATTTTFANIEALLITNLGPDAMHRFAAIGAGDDVARKKPAPDIYQHVLKRLDATPEECVALEDSANGVRSAKSAGLFTIVTPSYWTSGEDFSAADMVLPGLGSAACPLPPPAAALVGNTMLGIREIDRQFSLVREYD